MATLSDADRLRVKIEFVKPELLGASFLLFDDSRIRPLYRDYLITYHGILRATIPLFESARREALARGGATAQVLAGYLEKHIEEEEGEDEWALQDLEALDVDRSAVLARVPSANVARLVGAQYYWVLHVDPVAVLGYLAALERDPTSLEFIDDLVRRTGYERSAFRTLIAHAERDPDHARELDDLLDRIELTGGQWDLVTLSAMASVQQLARVFDDIVQAVDLRKVRTPGGVEPALA